MTDQAPMTDERAILALRSALFLTERPLFDYIKSRLRANVQQSDNGGEAVAWQRRIRMDAGHWYPWYEFSDADQYGNDPQKFPAMVGRWECEYRPLYAAPPRAPVAEGVERAAEVPAADEAMVERGLLAARDASDARLARYKVVEAILTAALQRQPADADRVDAERYRALKEFLGREDREWELIHSVPNPTYGVSQWLSSTLGHDVGHEEIDAAIDSARAEGGK